ncbi:hypothetical protein [Ottowia sp.]|uniref:hypothetical protein n=1 Tax=Ottowia sp. TaxID=1898956 RepID=UPI003A8B2D45
MTIRWLPSLSLTEIYDRWTGRTARADRVANRLEDIRLSMLDMLGDDGARRYPQVARRIRASADAQALWYVRAELMAALAGLYGEKTARTRMVSLSVLFDGMLPKGMASRPTVLRSTHRR